MDLNFREETWMTQDKNKIKVKDMKTLHIQNCIRCIKEGRINFVINMGWATDNDYQEFDEDTEERERWLKIFNKELELRKDE